MTSPEWLGALLLAMPAPSPAPTGGTMPSAVLASEFIFERAPFPAAHASTIVETRGGGLVAAWFGGTAEGQSDVAIWVSRHDGTKWRVPVRVADGVQGDGTRYPCWNPVLFEPSNGPLLLFYKVGPSPREWWGEVRTSADAGGTWSDAVKLPAGILGPIRAKPVELPGGEMLAGSSTEHAGWVVHMERLVPPASMRGAWTLADLASAGAWRKTGPLDDPAELAAIQPTILVHSPVRLQVLCRSRQGVIAESWSEDAGRTWSRIAATLLPNPSAGIDALRLADGRFVLVYNPTRTGRETLAVALSGDGRAWHRGLVLEDSAGEYSYPAVIQSRDGLLHVTYTWHRQRIKHVVLDPARLK